MSMFLYKRSKIKPLDLSQDSGIYQCFVSNDVGHNVTGVRYSFRKILHLLESYLSFLVGGFSLDVRSSGNEDDEEEYFAVSPFVFPESLVTPSKPNLTQLSADSVMIM
jgi:hypothetical protein